MEIVTGILLGLSTLLFIGPVFFYLVEVTLTKGTFAGIIITIAIIVGDSIYVYFCLNGIQGYLDKPEHVTLIAVTGGLLLIVLGLEHIFKSPKTCDLQKNASTKSLMIIFLKGFTLNFINPFVFAVWIGFFTYSETKFSIEEAPIILGCIIITIFVTDVLKVILAQKLSHFLNTEKLVLFRKTIGIFLILFATRLFWVAF